MTTLSTKTIVFGATNPKGQYDPDQCIAYIQKILFFFTLFIFIFLYNQYCGRGKLISRHQVQAILLVRDIFFEILFLDCPSLGGEARNILFFESLREYLTVIIIDILKF